MIRFTRRTTSILIIASCLGITVGLLSFERSLLYFASRGDVYRQVELGMPRADLERLLLNDGVGVMQFGLRTTPTQSFTYYFSDLWHSYKITVGPSDRVVYKEVLSHHPATLANIVRGGRPYK